MKNMKRTLFMAFSLLALAAPVMAAPGPGDGRPGRPGPGGGRPGHGDHGPAPHHAPQHRDEVDKGDVVKKLIKSVLDHMIDGPRD